MKTSTNYVLLENGKKIVTNSNYDAVYDCLVEMIISINEQYPTATVYVESTNKGVRLDNCIVYCSQSEDDEEMYIRYKIKKIKGNPLGEK